MIRSSTIPTDIEEDSSRALVMLTHTQFRQKPIESLRKAFGPVPMGKLLNGLLDEFASAEERLFDSVNQVRMDCWHKGRVVLIGDAAWCLTLYSGMGVSTGLQSSNSRLVAYDLQSTSIRVASAA